MGLSGDVEHVQYLGKPGGTEGKEEQREVLELEQFREKVWSASV